MERSGTAQSILRSTDIEKPRLILWSDRYRQVLRWRNPRPSRRSSRFFAIHHSSTAHKAGNFAEWLLLLFEISCIPSPRARTSNSTSARKSENLPTSFTTLYPIHPIQYPLSFTKRIFVIVWLPIPVPSKITPGYLQGRYSSEVQNWSKTTEPSGYSSPICERI